MHLIIFDAGDGDRNFDREVPSFNDVVIEPGKITDYAFNPNHPVGGSKYRVINRATGLTASDAVEIERQIRAGVRGETPAAGRVDQYGRRWVVDVTLVGSGGSITVRTAWITDSRSSTPRLVTISFP